MGWRGGGLGGVMLGVCVCVGGGGGGGHGSVFITFLRGLLLEGGCNVGYPSETPNILKPRGGGMVVSLLRFYGVCY